LLPQLEKKPGLPGASVHWELTREMPAALRVSHPPHELQPTTRGLSLIFLEAL